MKIMNRIFMQALLLLFAAGLSFTSAFAASLPIGYMSWDVTIPRSTGSFDIINMTGPNSSGDPLWPVSTSVSLSSLSLTVGFTNGSTTVFGPAYFTLSADGLSFNGGDIPIGGVNPLPEDAILSGLFSPTSLTLFDGSTPSILSSFSAEILSPGGMSDGDNAIIFAETGGGGGGGGGGITPVPEPGTWMLMSAGLACLMFFRRKAINFRSLFSGTALLRSVAIFSCMFLVSAGAWAAVTPVKLNTWTAPDNGVAGVSNVNITGSGFPAGTVTPGNVNIVLSTSCGGAASATTTALSVKTIIGNTKRVQFQIPASLATGIYFISISDSADAAPFASSNCSEVNVTHTNPTLSACIPTSSLGVLTQGVAPSANVTAYVPNGCWACGTTGVQTVPLEPLPVSAPASIATPSVVNSCSSNPATGQTVCSANNTDVYLITGTTLNTILSSSSNTTTSFSGGSCRNCGVAINALTNQAVIPMGLTGGSSGTGIQFLDLNTNTFGTAIPLAHHVSEDISIDPTRGFILSPNESSTYDLIQPTGMSSAKEFGNLVSGGGEFDSAAEDCTTGIALSSSEFTSNVFIADLTQATLTAGSPGTWTAPSRIVTLTGPGFSAGTSGISVAPGSSHLAIVTGEFGGNRFAVLQLPSTSGTGTPDILDYAVAAMPSLPTGGVFSSGLDPHTITAYTSPNDGKAYGVMANSPPPTHLGVIDLAAVLAAPRVDDITHLACSPTTSTTCHQVAPSFDMHTVVRYVATH